MAERPPGPARPRPSNPGTPRRKREPDRPQSARSLPADARRAACAALGRIESQYTALEAALDGTAGFSGLSTRDRAFARLLLATAMRRAGEIDAVLARLIERPLPQGARVVRNILALGIVQLLYLGTPSHAAVATAVEMTEALNQQKFKGLVNAVLRRVAREGKALIDGLDEARLNTPDWLWQNWAAAYGEAAARAIASAHLAEPPLDLCPRDPGEAAALAAELDAELLATGAVRQRKGGAVSELAGYGEGRWWVQDAAAQVPARLLGPITGLRVLDMCAAPGGKTLQLAAAGAHVTALDQSHARLDMVAANLARTGLKAQLAEADARRYEAPPFDAVLLDAPCSATGTIRRHPDIARLRREDDIAAATRLQDELLDAAARLTRPGGQLVYAVCSLEPAEGEDRIAAFLARHTDFTPQAVTAAELPGLEAAATDAGFFRSLPSMLAGAGGCDGFFTARLRRSGEAAT